MAGDDNDKKLSNLRPFQPGQSGNPGGRPRFAGISKAARNKLDETQPSGLTVAEEIVAALVKQALRGNVMAAKELREITEGRLPETFRGIFDHNITENDPYQARQKLFAKLIGVSAMAAESLSEQENV